MDDESFFTYIPVISTALNILYLDILVYFLTGLKMNTSRLHILTC